MKCKYEYKRDIKNVFAPERMSEEKAREILAGPHHCTYPGVVASETSVYTYFRKINDTKTNDAQTT